MEPDQKAGARALGVEERSPVDAAASRAPPIGRDAEEREILAAIAEGHRLMTITGPGGQGKTCLLRHLGRCCAPAFAEVVFCDLASVHTFDAALSAIAHALAVPLQSAARDDAVLRLGAALRGRGRLLLLLDNFEQLVREAAGLVLELSTLSPETVVMVTSRELLGLDVERVLDLGPLVGASGADLFLARAKSARPDVDETAFRRSEIETLVNRLDGNPLAIELAAARVTVLSPTAMIQRLEQRFALLRSMRRDVPARHSSLWHAIDWSWQLLSEGEQKVLTDLSVFHGSFALEAAEAVVAAPADLSVLDALHALCLKSLLRSSLDGHLDFVRFRLAESIRAYAEGQASELGRWDSAVERHGGWYATEGAVLHRAAWHGGETDAVDRLYLDMANILAAHDRSLDSNPERAVATALSLEPWLSIAGPGDLWRGLLETAAAAATRLDVGARAKVQRARGDAKRAMGDMVGARADLEQAEAAAVESGDLETRAQALYSLCQVLLYQGSSNDARAGFARTADLAGEAGDHRTRAIALSVLACLDSSRERMADALSVVEGCANLHARGVVLCNSGHLERDLGDLMRSRAHLELALEHARRGHDRALEGVVLGNLATTMLVAGDAAAARRTYEAALALHRRVGNRRFEGFAEAWLGILAAEERLPAEAETRLRAALAIAESLGDFWSASRPLAHLAVLVARRGDLEEAAELLARSRRAAKDEIDTGYGEVLTVIGALYDLLVAQHLNDAPPSRLASMRGRRPAAGRTGRGNEARTPPATSKALRHARELIDATAFPGTAGGAGEGAPVARSAISDPDLTIALRMLATAVEEVELRLSSGLAVAAFGGAAPSEAVGPTDAARGTVTARRTRRVGSPAGGGDVPAHPQLVIGNRAQWFLLGGGGRVDLSQRQPLGRVLARLCDARVREPGSPVPSRELLAAGWPDERVLARAGANRVYNAIATLRRLGLRSAIITQGDGYLLDARLPLRQSR